MSSNECDHEDRKCMKRAEFMNNESSNSQEEEDNQEEHTDEDKKPEEFEGRQLEQSIEPEIKDDEVEENENVETEEDEMKYHDEQEDSTLEEEATMNGEEEAEWDDSHQAPSQEGVPLEIDDEKSTNVPRFSHTTKENNSTSKENLISASTEKATTKKSQSNKTTKGEIYQGNVEGMEPVTYKTLLTPGIVGETQVAPSFGIIVPRNLFGGASNIKLSSRMNQVLIPAKVVNRTGNTTVKLVKPRMSNRNLPVSYDPIPEDQHKHFGQGFRGYSADGGVMGPSNWQARNWFSLGTLRDDGVRWLGRCCGDECRNGGIGCCGKCPRCIDCP